MEKALGVFWVILLVLTVVLVILTHQISEQASLLKNYEVQVQKFVKQVEWNRETNIQQNFSLTEIEKRLKKLEEN